jgi:hypothetical protein
VPSGRWIWGVEQHAAQASGGQEGGQAGLRDRACTSEHRLQREPREPGAALLALDALVVQRLGRGQPSLHYFEDESPHCLLVRASSASIQDRAIGGRDAEQSVVARHRQRSRPLHDDEAAAAAARDMIHQEQGLVLGPERWTEGGLDTPPTEDCRAGQHRRWAAVELSTHEVLRGAHDLAGLEAVDAVDQPAEHPSDLLLVPQDRLTRHAQVTQLGRGDEPVLLGGDVSDLLSGPGGSARHRGSVRQMAPGTAGAPPPLWTTAGVRGAFVRVYWSWGPFI